MYTQHRHILPLFALLLGCTLFMPAAWAEASLSADDIVRRADEIRFPPTGFQVDLDVASIEKQGAKPEIAKYRIISRGNENTLVMTTYPAVDRGQIMLMKDHDLWVFLPKVSQPIRLPLAQRLTGQVANGDLARANFTGDYDATLLREETIENTAYYVLELTAGNRRVTYHKVHYWVDKANFRPLKAEFYALSGNLLKTAHYQRYLEMAGAIRPTRLIMQDALKPEARSVMQYKNMVLRDIPNKFFSKNYLKKLQ